MSTEVALSSRIPEIIAELPVIVDAAMKESARLVEQDAKERVPVRTGKLRDAIHTERKSWATYEVVGGDGEAFYGHMVEFGTEHSGGEPFLVPALEENREVTVQIVTSGLRGL